MKKLLTTTYTIAILAIALVGLLFVATLLPIPGNVEVKVVKSGSMEPAIGVGSIVVIKPAASYVVGDVITFGADTKTQIPTTHRIVATQGEGANMTFTTKGDANDSEDNATTAFASVKGKVLFTVPYVGYALAFARTKLGFFLLVGVPALLVFLEEGRSIYMEILRVRARRRRARRNEYQETEEVMPQQVVAQRTSSDIRRKKSMGVFVVLLGLGVVSAGGYFGNTVAFYANAATSHGNTMHAGIFAVPERATAFVLGAFEVAASDAVVSVPDAPEVEVSEPVIVVTE